MYDYSKTHCLCWLFFISDFIPTLAGKVNKCNRYQSKEKIL